MSDDEGLPPYAETMSLLSVTGDHPRAKVLATLIGKHYTELTVGNLVTLTGEDEDSIDSALIDLLDVDIVEVVETDDGVPTRYRIDTDDPIAKGIGELDQALFEREHGSLGRLWPEVADEDDEG